MNQSTLWSVLKQKKLKNHVKKTTEYRGIRQINVSLFSCCLLEGHPQNITSQRTKISEVTNCKFHDLSDTHLVHFASEPRRLTDTLKTYYHIKKQMSPLFPPPSLPLSHDIVHLQLGSSKPMVSSKSNMCKFLSHPHDATSI